MEPVTALYRASLALLTDLYQLTMAQGYWQLGRADDEAVFHVTFRTPPFDGGYAIACGLASVIDHLQHLRFDDSDVGYLAGLTGSDGRPLFDRDFLQALRQFEFVCDLDAMPEGTLVFPHEPLVRVRGPILQCQLLETPLLTMMNYQTLVATKATRVCQAAKGEPVLEFGLRRAQHIDGGVAASRATYVGGCAATSNVLAGKLFGIPVKGTHAHSWIMAFDSELEAFDAYAQVMPNNAVFLVDTYDTLQGVRHAIEVGRRLRERGYEMTGIRLDSGDLAYLSMEARKLLDEAGFEDAAIVASSELDEHLISSLKEQGSPIVVWGVGTKLVTAYDQPALGGVYKLAALRRQGGDWQHKIKISEQAVKTTTPGMLQVRRFRNTGRSREAFVADMIYDEILGLPSPSAIVDPADPTRRRPLGPELACEDVLVPIFRRGQRVYDPPALNASRARTAEQLAGLHPTIKRFVNPHEYPVGLARNLHELKTELILQARGVADDKVTPEKG